MIVFTRKACSFSIQSPGFSSDESRGPLILSAMQPSRPLLLLKAVLQSGALRSGKSRVLPTSGNSPPSPSPRQLPQAVLMTVGQANPGFHKCLACSQHSTAGRAQHWGKEHHPPPPAILSLGPRGWSPAEGRAALVCTCPSVGSDPGPSLPADFPALA